MKKLIMTLTLMFASVASVTAERHALVIGLGEQLDRTWGKINGDKDVPKVVAMLYANGYDDISRLVNEQATKAAIVDNLRALSGRCRRGDTVYIHFSGHGQRVTDLDGDEPDGWDEAWIPYDAYRHYSSSYRGECHLVDDELYIYLSEIRARIGSEGVMAVVVDACHSGDSTRGDGSVEEECIRGVYDTFDLPGKRKSSTCAKPEEKWVTLSACRSYQLNQEFCGMGKLTYLLTNYWSLLRALDNRTLLGQLDARMQSREMSGRYPQNPFISGDGTRFCDVFK